MKPVSGSLISPEPVGGRLGGGNACAARFRLSFVARVNLFNTLGKRLFLWRSGSRARRTKRCRQACSFAHWNGTAAQLDNEHRPLILVQAAGLGDFIVTEMTERKGVASNGLRG